MQSTLFSHSGSRGNRNNAGQSENPKSLGSAFLSLLRGLPPSLHLLSESPTRLSRHKVERLTGFTGAKMATYAGT